AETSAALCEKHSAAGSGRGPFVLPFQRPNLYMPQMNQQADSPTNIVRTLWHGEVSVYEELSLLSFLQHGHTVELYSYEPIAVPEGVKLCDAREILPEDQIFMYTQ